MNVRGEIRLLIVLMLNAGDKSTQKRDTRRALKLAAELGDDL